EIGMAYRGHGSKDIFDFDDAMGNSTCVACGECVQACPTGALMEASLLDEHQARTVYADLTVDSRCPYCAVGCQTQVFVHDERIARMSGREGPATRSRRCVKGRLAFDYVAQPVRPTKPLIRRAGVATDPHMQIRDGEWDKVFREASWEEAPHLSASGLK